MTSTISSNKTKKPLLSMILWSLKETLPLTIIYSFLLFVCYPMYVMLSKNSSGPDKFDYADCQMVLLGVAPLIIGIFTIITACVMFSIYHKKRSVDLYASLPINKTTLFISKYVSGLLLLIVPLVIFMSLGLLVSGQVSSINAFVTYYRMLGYIVSIINMYSMLAFVSMICGGTVDTVVTFGVINAGVVGCLLSGVNLVNSIVPGLYDIDLQMYQPLTFMLLFSLCPFAMPYLFGMFSHIYSDAELTVDNFVNHEWFASESKALVVWFVLAIVYFVAGMLLVKKRNNENVQNGFIFNFPKVIIYIIASVGAGVIIGYFFASGFCVPNDGFKTMLMFIAGALIGSVLAYLIVTLIFNKGPKRFIKGLPVFAGSFVVVALFYVAIATGLIGVSNIPKVEDIKSVHVSGNNDYFHNTEVYPIVRSIGKEYEKTDLFIEDKDVIKNTVALHQAIVDGLHEEAGAFFNFYRYYSLDVVDGNYGYEPGTIVIEYKLNNGRKISKAYMDIYYDYEKLVDKYNAVISNDAYKQENNKLVKCSNANEANAFRIDFSAVDRYMNIPFGAKAEDIDAELVANEDTRSNEPVILKNIEAANLIYSTLREEFIADKEYAESLKANLPVYVKPTESNSEIYDEKAFKIKISFLAFNDMKEAENKVISIGAISGACNIEPEENYTITKDKYPNTWALLNSYCEQENTNNINLYNYKG